MFEISVELSFSAAHRLMGYKGKCENMHGHNWRVEASCQAGQLDKKGMVVDFSELKKALNKILMQLDHKVLNDISYFKKVNPTSENIAKYIYNKLKAHPLTGTSSSKLKAVSVWETDTSCATYYE